MKLAILTQYYPPEIGAPQARLSSLARAFVRQGHEVTVLTAMPSYPLGKLHSGYGGIMKREEDDGVRLVRTFILPTQRLNLLPRLANYISFTVSSAMVGSAFLGRPDYLLVESPPIFLGLSGIWLSRLTGARLIFNVSDLWPESAVSLGVLRMGSLAHTLGKWLEAFCYRHAWLVTGQSREIITDVVSRFPTCHPFHLSNGVETGRFRPDCATPTSVEALRNGTNRCIALYAGLHGLAQGLDRVVDAAGLLTAEDGIEVVLMGDGPTKSALQEVTSVQHVRNVRFLSHQPHAKMPAFLAAADVIVVPLARQLHGAVPSKLYEAMAAGRAIVLIAEGEAASIIRTCDAGLVVRPGDARGIAEALRELARDPDRRHRLGANGRRAAVQHFDRRRIADEFIAFLETHLMRRKARYAASGQLGA